MDRRAFSHRSTLALSVEFSAPSARPGGAASPRSGSKWYFSSCWS